jgi:bacillithiol system protein YtxJ
MTMTTRPDPIREEGELDAAFEAETFLLFKHSFRCPVSLRAFDEYRAWCADTGGVATAWIDVVAHRPLSLAAAERSGVGHESPQALLLHQGRVVWDASHGAITRQSLAEAVARP